MQHYSTRKLYYDPARWKQGRHPFDRRRVGTPPLSAWAHQYTEVDDAEQDAEDVRTDPEVAAASHGGFIRVAKVCIFADLQVTGYYDAQ